MQIRYLSKDLSPGGREVSTLSLASQRPSPFGARGGETHSGVSSSRSTAAAGLR